MNKIDTAKQPRQSKFPQQWWLILVGVLMAWTPVRLCWPIWFSAGSPLGIQVFIPLVVAWLIWTKRHEWQTTAQELTELFPDPQDPRRRGTIFLVVLGGVGSMLSLIGSYSFGSIFSFYILIIGSIYYLFGPFLLRVILSPLLLLVFMIPPPSSVIQNITNNARLIAASMTGGGLELIGVQNRVLGNEISIVQTGWRLHISPSLSGLSTLFTVILVTIVYLLWNKSTIFKSAISIIIVLFITSIVNVTKLVIIGYIGHNNVSTAEILSKIPALPAVLLIIGISFLFTRPLHRTPKNQALL